MVQKLLKNKRIQDGGLYLFANLVNKGIGFLTIPIFTRLMTTSEYGQVDTYLSFAALLLPVIGLYLGRAKRNAFVDFQGELTSFDKSIFIASSITAFAVTFMMFFLGSFFSPALSRMLIVICCIHAFMSYMIECEMISLLMEEKAKKRALLMSLPNIFVSIVSVMVLLLMDDKRQYGRIGVYFVIYLFVGGSIYLKTVLKKGAHFRKKYISYAAAISIPLIFHGLAVSILSSSDRIMLTYFSGSAETGIYSLYYNVSLIPLVLTSAIENVWIPWFTKQMSDEGQDKIRTAANLCTYLVAAFTMVMLMISPEIIKIMADKKYWGYEQLMVPIIICPFVLYANSNLINYQQYLKKTKTIARNTLIAAISNIALNAVFIPHYGALAASYTTLISYLLLYFLHYESCKEEAGKLFDIRSVGVSMLALLAAVLFFTFFLDFLMIRYLLAAVIVGVLACVLKNKREMEKRIN